MLALSVAGCAIFDPSVTVAFGISQEQSADVHGPDGAAGMALAILTGVASA
jgi:hypothetical protein